MRASTELLRDAVDHLAFVSSISAYADRTRPGLVETDALAGLPAGAAEELSGESYGALKARCEAVVEELMSGRVAVFRAGLLFGPHDPTERSGYWPMRLARGGEVLAPGRRARPVQLVDTRDVAAWMVRIVEMRTPGIFNTTGPDRTLAMSEFLDACQAVAGDDARLTWVDEEFLLGAEVAAYSELPLWVPETYHAFQTVDCRRAFAAGLRFRPLADTVRDTLAWARTAPERPGTRLGGVTIPPAMASDREAELLARWHAMRARA